MIIIAPCIANGCVAINETSILEQREELIPKRIDSFHWLKWEKVFPTVFVSSKVSFSIFPSLVSPYKCKVVTMITGKLRLCSLSKLQVEEKIHLMQLLLNHYKQEFISIWARNLTRKQLLLKFSDLTLIFGIVPTNCFETFNQMNFHKKICILYFQNKDFY